jgi:hypothetical protein
MRDRLTATTFAPLTKFTADVAWTYNASANLLTDAFLSFAGNVTPPHGHDFGDIEQRRYVEFERPGRN